jgi:hypothetical protein
MGVAEGVGFEPTDACTSAVFKTAAIDHSATLPQFSRPPPSTTRPRFPGCAGSSRD